MASVPCHSDPPLVRSVTQYFKDNFGSKKRIHKKIDCFESEGSLLVNYGHFSQVQVFWGEMFILSFYDLLIVFT